MADTEEVMKISKMKLSVVIVIAIALIAVVAGNLYFFSSASLTNPFLIAALLSVGILVPAAYFAYKNSKNMSEMHGMMNGMAFSMMASFAVGTLIALSTGDFVLGIIAGTISGLLLGIPIASKGLARMEGMMAAPMGGSMGAMLGVMIRFYNVQLFMQFFFVVLVFIMYEMTRMNSNHCKCAIPGTLKYLAIIIGIVAILSTFVLAYSIDNTGGGIIFGSKPNSADPSQAQQNGNVQEINMRAEPLGYDPDYITVKKGIPVKINIAASQDAGCTRSIVFPDFGINKVIPRGGSGVIEFTPTKEGTYQFRCSMNMARGTLVVQ